MPFVRPLLGRIHASVVVWLVAIALAGCSAAAAPALPGGAASPADPPPGASTDRTLMTAGIPMPVPTATPAPPSTTPVPAATPIPTPTFGPTGQTVQARVNRVVDGDTIEVEVDGVLAKVRYIGVDTPETKDPNSPVEPFGPEASAANAALVDGRVVLLEKDVSETDRFGRLLRDVWIKDGDEWLLVNLLLVRQGYAAVSTFPPDVKYVDELFVAEREARDAGRGLWGAEPAPTPTPKPTPEPTAKPTKKPPADCHPSYDPCLPIVDDLNCPDVRAMGKAPVDVIGPDEYRLDNDHDGTGCE